MPSAEALEAFGDVFCLLPKEKSSVSDASKMDADFAHFIG